MWWLLACVSLPDPPQILSVQPGYGYRGEDTTITVTGENFFPQVIIDGAAPDAGQVDDAVQVWLIGPQGAPEEIPLAATLRGYGQIEAVVPAGLVVDSYDLRVRTPSGEEVERAGVYRVTDTRADRLALQVASAAWSVGEEAELQIVLQDPEGLAVAQALQVELVGNSSRAAPDFAFVDGGLDGQEAIEGETGGAGVRGWLGESGSGRVRVASLAEDDISFTVRPVLEADRIEGATQLLSWEPGGLAGARLRRVPEAAEVVAGEAFLVEVELIDALGNALEDETASVILFESTECGGWYTTATVRGRDQIPVTLESACDADTLQAFVAGTIATTDPFAVVAGPLSAFDVVVFGDSVVAGSGQIGVVATAVDGYGNTVEEHVAPVRWRDDLGGLDTARGVGGATCSGFFQGQQICTLTLLTTGSGDQAEATFGAASGRSGPFDVLPDAAARVLVTTEARVIAGETFAVRVEQQDAWGNGVPFDGGAVALSDGTGTLSCASEIGGEDGATGAASYTCALTAATPATAVEAALGALIAASAPVEVINGPLVAVSVSVPEVATAGEPFSVEIWGEDAWGNPYVVGADLDVELLDPEGELAGTVWTLGADGAASGELTLTLAGERTVAAWQGGVPLGESAPVSVAAGVAASIWVGADSYVEAGAAAAVRLEALDGWGNLVEGYAGSGWLHAQHGGCEDTEIAGFDAGVAVIAASCVSPVLGEVLEAAVDDGSGVISGSSTLDVVDFGCGDLDLSLWLAGEAELIVCQVGGSATVVGEVVDAGAGAPVLYHYTAIGTTGEGAPSVEVRRTLSAVESWIWTIPARYTVIAVGVDAAGCADRAEAVAWVGAEDGSAAGPVSVSAAAASVANGSQVAVDLEATDCSGDPAQGSLRVQADLGELLGPAATGSGLEIPLDAAGSATLDWAFTEGYAGVATLRAGGAAALGEAAVSVTGDSVRPTVDALSPAGYAEDLASFTITFSEPMLATSLTASAVQLEGSASGSRLVTVAPGAEAREVVVVPVSPLDVAEVWRLVLTADLRDAAAGNRLSGDWSGNAAAFTGYAGAVPTAPVDVPSCVLSTPRLYPDGDPGAGEEADEVWITPAAVAAAWWRVEVLADGEPIRVIRASGTDASVAWDGRGVDGVVVAPGIYTLSIRAVDGYEGQGAPCTGSVEIARHVGG